MLRVSAVYEKQSQTTNERPDGSSYVTFSTVLDSRECLVNRNYIVSVTAHNFDEKVGSSILEDSFPKGTKFTTLVLDGNSFRKSEMIVVGSFEKFCQLLEGTAP